jgi:hypothetical protein
MNREEIALLLKSDDVETRKQGVSALAELNDARVLATLHRIAESDPDDELRGFASAVIASISVPEPFVSEKLPADIAPPRASVETMPELDDLMPSLDDLHASAPVALSENDTHKAKIHYDKAFDLHLKGNDARAVVELGTAFALNPAYTDDQTAVRFAAELTGLPVNEASEGIRNPANWQAFTERHGGIRRSEEPSLLRSFYGWVFAGIGIMILVALLVAYFNSEAFAAALSGAASGLRESFSGFSR